ncbi:hypothetical protein CDAR_392301 [Caerostris darwini]|uniref:Uncharacterized protein n=1 Tax=Caerostris darwini TaxID=1538125 RepID=A0AAV4SM27_9ARAC|nr:hypothetical protein CDAR_392301 [Caerostris darwini]
MKNARKLYEKQADSFLDAKMLMKTGSQSALQKMRNFTLQLFKELQKHEAPQKFNYHAEITLMKLRSHRIIAKDGKASQVFLTFPTCNKSRTWNASLLELGVSFSRNERSHC